MDFLIQENLTFATPDLSQLVNEAHHDKMKEGNSKRLIVEIAAIHEGVSKNYNRYTQEALESAVPTWMSPFPKPLLLNHDLESEPLGRMVNSEFKRNAEGKSYIQLRAAVIDPEAAMKVIDGRYLTGSVGGVPTAAICSICHSDIIAAAKEGERCGHMRGQTYNEQVCVYEHRGISFHEYSFVNAPGDSESQIQGHVSESNATDLSVYSLDMDAGKLAKFQEQEGFIDVREMMSESDAFKAYLDVAFGSKYANDYEMQEKAKNITFDENISTIAKESDGSDLEHKQMTDKNTQEVTEETHDDEDILDVADRLTSDLSEESDQAADEEVDKVEETEDSDTEVTEESTETDEPEAKEESSEEEVKAEEDSEEAPAEDSEEAKVEETEATDEEEAEGTDTEEASTEETVEEDEAKSEESEEVTEEVTEEAEETVAEESEEPAEAPASDLESRISELEEENAKLKDQNKKMKDALHAELAEKVVDARIAVGHLSTDDREDAIAEHKARSASSLADALVDVRNFAEKNNFQVSVVNGTVPSLEIKAEALPENNDIAPIESDDQEQVVEESVDPAAILEAELTALLSNGTERYLRSKTHNK